MEIIDREGRKGLVVGVANDESLAWSAAQHYHSAGAELGVTFLNDKARAYVEPLARKIEAPLLLPCNVTVPSQLEAVSHNLNVGFVPRAEKISALYFARSHDVLRRRDL